MTTQKFKVGDKVKVARKCEFQSPEYNVWASLMDKYIGQEGIIIKIDRRYGIEVSLQNGDCWRFPSQSLELVTDEETQKEPEKMKQQYVVLVWEEEEGVELCGDLVLDETGIKTFIGTKKEAKDYRDYMREGHPEATYKIAKYPFVIEGYDTVETQPEQPKKLVKKWQWVLRNKFDTLFVSDHYKDEEEIELVLDGQVSIIQKIDSTMIEVEEN